MGGGCTSGYSWNGSLESQPSWTLLLYLVASCRKFNLNYCWNNVACTLKFFLEWWGKGGGDFKVRGYEKQREKDGGGKQVVVLGF